MTPSVEEILASPLSTRDRGAQVKLARSGRPRPSTSSSHHQQSATSSPSHNLMVQLKIARRDWLTSCPKRSLLFCWPCLLFPSDASRPWCDLGVSFEVSEEELEEHADSTHHLDACQELSTLASESEITPKRRQGAMKKVPGRGRIPADEWTPWDVRKHFGNKSDGELEYQAMLDAFLLLSLKIDGTEALEKSPIEGDYNFQNEEQNVKQFFVFKLPGFKSNLDAMLEKRVGFFRDLHRAYRDLLQATVDVMRDEINREVKSARFVSVLLEDLSTQPEDRHVAIILRYALKGKLFERFVAFKEFYYEDATAEAMIELLRATVQDFSLSDKLVACCCDGFSLSNRELDLFIDLMSKEYPRAVFTDCSQLNRLLFNRVRHLSSLTRVLLEQLPSMESFLVEHRDQLAREPFSINLPVHLGLTQTCSLMHKLRNQMVDYLKKKDPPVVIPEFECKTSTGFWYFLRDFNTMLLIPFFAVNFTRSERLEERIRKHFDDAPTCERLIDEFADGLATFARDSFEKVWREAVSFHRHTSSKKLNIHDEFDATVTDYDLDNGLEWTTGATQLDDPEVKQRYQTLVRRLADSFVSLARRFRFNHQSRLLYFNLVSASNSDAFRIQFPEPFLDLVCQQFPEHFDPVRLRTELECLYLNRFADRVQPDEVLHFLHGELPQVYPETIKLTSLVLTIPGRLFHAANHHTESSRAMLARVYQDPKFEHVRFGNEGFIRIELRLFQELLSRQYREPPFYKAVLERMRHYYQLRVQTKGGKR